MRDRRTAFLLFLCLNCLYILTSSGRPRTSDEYMTLFQTESLIERRSTAVPQSLGTQNFYGKFDVQGQPRSPYPAGQAILAVPYVWFGRNVLARLPGIPAGATAAFYLDGFAATLSSATCAAAAMSVFFLLLRRLTLRTRDSLILTACVAFGTLLFPYSGYFFSEPLAALLLIGATYVLFGREAAPTRTQAVTAGIFLGLAGWVRPTLFLALLVFLLAIILRGGARCWKFAALTAIFPAASALAYLTWNQHLFGRVLDFGYPETAEFGKHLNTFQTPFYVGLAGFLVSPGKSIFLYSPLLVAAIFGMRSLWRRDRGLATLCAGLPLLYLLFYMRYTQWEGGYCNGPRYLLPSIVVSCLALGPLMQSRTTRHVIAVLAVLGFLVQAVTYSTSFLEDQVGGGGYYDARFNYRLAYDPIITQAQRSLAYVSGKAAPLGLGFDRWFIFLQKLGISAGTLVVIAVLPLTLALWSFSALWRVWYAPELGTENRTLASNH